MDLALLNLVLSAILTGLIWTIQVVHYPSFLDLGQHGFAAGYRRHLRGIIPLTGVLMTSELTAFLLWWYQSGWTTDLLLPAGCLAWIWGATGFLHIPQHRRLSAGFDARLIHRLVVTNWGRTLAWTIRTVWLWWYVAA
ncbi:MAG: hypothetical protein H6568_10195 [Lewinellaceae bacterium]|nr:hypothetical protein [Saprospiraceae bacterium]MCB9313131.1 hypothetical protein [Lewinellaceae bacterium]HRW74692.1 hypothetical protein [Saprospiraceae bacterium]